MIRKKALRLASRFGYAQPLIGLYDATVGLPRSYDDIDIEIDCRSGSSDRGIVVFPYAHQSKTHSYKYGILAAAFEMEGYEPVFVLPDTSLPMSCIREDNPKEAIRCDLKEYGAKKVLQEFGYEWEYLTDHISGQTDYEELSIAEIDAQDYRGIDLTEFAKASTRKVTKKYHIRSERDEWIKRQFLRSGVLLVDAYENLMDSYDVVSMIAHDDKYNQGGIPLSVADKNEVHAYSSTLGWMNESLVMGNVSDRNSFPHYEAEQLVDRFLNRPLKRKQKKRVDEIMTGRIDGKGETRARYAAQTDRSVETTDSATTVGMFTNLIWDANLEVNNCPYPNVFNWIRDTLSELGGKPGVELIIKPHPAEDSRGTNESVRGWITDQYPELPENVEVLAADTDVNTYQMIDDIDVGVVYNSTVGFEMVYTGVPAITAGETHYRNLNISHDPVTTEEYLNLLRNVSQLNIDASRRRRVKRYIYFLLEGKHLEFPFVRTTSVRSYRFKPVTTDDIESNSTLEQIVKRCTSGQPVFDPKLDWLVAPQAKSD